MVISINNGNELNQLKQLSQILSRKQHLFVFIHKTWFATYRQENTTNSISRNNPPFFLKEVRCQTIISFVDPTHVATNFFSGTMVIKRTILKVLLLTNEPTKLFLLELQQPQIYSWKGFNVSKHIEKPFSKTLVVSS